MRTKGGVTREGAPSLIPEMLQICMKLDQVTLVAALSACAEIGDLKIGRWIHSYVNQNWNVKKNKHTVRLYNALLHMYAGCGVIDDTYELFKRMPVKSTVSWTTMISGFAKHGRRKDALNVFQMMVQKPDAITMLVVLNACMESGLVEQGRHIFKNMKQICGTEPKIEHYGCKIDLLTSGGLLEEAHRLIQHMPMEPNDAISEIAFFDLETSGSNRRGQENAILEFGCILVCGRTLVELKSYQTLVKPDDVSLLSRRSVRANGITAAALGSAPTFSDIADEVYNLLRGNLSFGSSLC